MRTNIVMNDELVEEAFRYADVRTKRELVDLALREFVENHRRRRDVRELRSRVRLRPDYDHKESCARVSLGRKTVRSCTWSTPRSGSAI